MILCLCDLHGHAMGILCLPAFDSDLVLFLLHLITLRRKTRACPSAAVWNRFLKKPCNIVNMLLSQQMQWCVEITHYEEIYALRILECSGSQKMTHQAQRFAVKSCYLTHKCCWQVSTTQEVTAHLPKHNVQHDIDLRVTTVMLIYIQQTPFWKCSASLKILTPSGDIFCVCFVMFAWNWLSRQWWYLHPAELML